METVSALGLELYIFHVSNVLFQGTVSSYLVQWDTSDICLCVETRKKG